MKTGTEDEKKIVILTKEELANKEADAICHDIIKQMIREDSRTLPVLLTFNAILTHEIFDNDDEEG